MLHVATICRMWFIAIMDKQWASGSWIYKMFCGCYCCWHNVIKTSQKYLVWKHCSFWSVFTLFLKGALNETSCAISH